MYSFTLQWCCSSYRDKSKVFIMIYSTPYLAPVNWLLLHFEERDAGCFLFLFLIVSCFMSVICWCLLCWQQGEKQSTFSCIAHDGKISSVCSCWLRVACGESWKPVPIPGTCPARARRCFVEGGTHPLPGTRILPRDVQQKRLPVLGWQRPWAEKCPPGGSRPGRESGRLAVSPCCPVTPKPPAQLSASCPKRAVLLGFLAHSSLPQGMILLEAQFSVHIDKSWYLQTQYLNLAQFHPHLMFLGYVIRRWENTGCSLIPSGTSEPAWSCLKPCLLV